MTVKAKNELRHGNGLRLAVPREWRGLLVEYYNGRREEI